MGDILGGARLPNGLAVPAEVQIDCYGWYPDSGARAEPLVPGVPSPR
jgi:hypothetical protein